MNLTVFNSWQSDSLYNSKAIRAALRDASNKLETQIAGLHIKIDEATSNQVGTLHILTTNDRLAKATTLLMSCGQGGLKTKKPTKHTVCELLQIHGCI
jgi:hypothetical protein